MIEFLRRGAQTRPERPAVVTHDLTVSYAELLAMAEGAATALSELGADRIALADHEAAPVIALMAAAAATGVEVCLLPPDGAEQVLDLVGRFDHTVVVTDRDDLPESALPAGVRRVGLAGLLATPAQSAPGDLPAHRPHLVLTTGTTGAPRGVRHDWGRLVRSTAHVQPAGDEHWLLCFGLHQFAGLQVLLHVLAAGATLVAPAPRRPREGLAAMRALGVTHASATPTYWRFLLAELRADGGPVPQLRQITLGGEAVPGPLLGELATTFPDAHVSQVYAASEFGSTGSMRDRRAGLSTAVLERGEDADVALKVVDGELWIRSRTGMVGYYGEPDVDAEEWRPTGDLVAVEDGRLVFLGRSSEIINVGGVKVHPLVIEERIGAVAGVDVARVYGRRNPMTGQIVAVEVVASAGADTTAIDAAIRAACADLPSASRPRSIRFVDEVSTTGSKIVRREAP
ncbi:acyl--CoA ligase [Nocardioides carbamazepini]|uniref:class I adenylate-forming enzyme family protein n=1 Tax=Nocardioides carbamazepini TaxID=2854259 RepID=UPI00214A4B77|nr:class I adenylate-forming enzyme family protein [Nocardioides carbamazepini]MCR1786191.1 acyl--CoA ligase [Nocardioides carbamazepini]